MGSELPLYEYQCKSCHSLTERIQKFSDPPLTVCPHCGGELEQCITAPAVQFKGAGWYVTDYAKKSGPGSGSSSGKHSSDSGSSSSENSNSGHSSKSGSSEGSKSEASSKSDTPKGESSPAKENK